MRFFSFLLIFFFKKYNLNRWILFPNKRKSDKLFLILDTYTLLLSHSPPQGTVCGTITCTVDLLRHKADALIAKAPLTFSCKCIMVVWPNCKLGSNIFFLLNSSHAFNKIRYSSSLPYLVALPCLAVFHTKSRHSTAMNEAIVTKPLPTSQGRSED